MPQTEVFTVPGQYKWTCPDGITSVTIKAQGGGGGGGHGTTLLGGGGGGGGGAATSTKTVSAGTQYDYQVGAGGNPGYSGEESWLGISVGDALATGGKAPTAEAGSGNGGLGLQGTASLLFTGGIGGGPTGGGGGGGGGSAAGLAANGNVGLTNSGSRGGFGGAPSAFGGAGGAGGTNNLGLSGEYPGGGGGGGAVGQKGGFGAPGKITLSYG